MNEKNIEDFKKYSPLEQEKENLEAEVNKLTQQVESQSLEIKTMEDITSMLRQSLEASQAEVEQFR